MPQHVSMMSPGHLGLPSRCAFRNSALRPDLMRKRTTLARSSGSGLAVMQPINLGSGEDPILDLDRCDALSRLGQIVQRDHCIAQRWAINQYVAVYERRWLACVGIDLSSSPLMCCP